MGTTKRFTTTEKRENPETGLLNPSFATIQKSAPKTTIAKPVARAKPQLEKKQRKVTIKTKEVEASP